MMVYIDRTKTVTTIRGQYCTGCKQENKECGGCTVKHIINTIMLMPELQITPETTDERTSARQTPPQEYFDALAAYGDLNVSCRQMIQSMHFVSFDRGVLTVEFAKKQILHMKMLERRKADLEKTFSNVFRTPVLLDMRLEGEKAADVGAAARRVISESYDIFGRENVDLNQED